MPIRPCLPLIVVFVMAVSSAACDDSHVTIVGAGPTSVIAGATLTSGSVRADPAIVAVQPFHPANCPWQPPWVAPVTLVLSGEATDLFLTEIGVHFTDLAGVREPLLTIPQPDLFRQFGSTRIAAFSRRTFPFSFGFGCLGRPPGSLTIVVLVRDLFDRETRFTTHVTIR